MGVSQAQVAEAVGVSQQSVNKYENHNIEPDIESLKRIADYFHTSIDYLVGHMRLTEEGSAYTFDLNASEARLIEGYRALTERQREYVSELIELLGEK